MVRVTLVFNSAVPEKPEEEEKEEKEEKGEPVVRVQGLEDAQLWKRYAADVSALTKSQTIHNDVRLFFPRVNQDLWTTEALLSTTPYFADKLWTSSSDKLSSNHVSRSKGKRKRDEEDDEDRDDEGRIDDSDDDTDEQFYPEHPKHPSRSNRSDTPSQLLCTSAIAAAYPSPTPQSLSPPSTLFEISNFSITTYAAVLCWLRTGHINFAPLQSDSRPLSSPKSLSPSKPTTRMEFLTTYSQSSPLLPLPASPKSVYRLAESLELPELQQLALLSFQSQLTTSNVMQECVSDASRLCSDVRDTAFDFARRNWDRVKRTEGLMEVKKLLGQNKLAGELALQLLGLYEN